MKKTKLNIATAMLLAGLAGTAHAVDIDDYTLNFSDAALADTGAIVADLTDVDEWKFTAWSVVGFHDNDLNDNISPGDTYEDFVLIRVDQFQNHQGNNITPLTYGPGFPLLFPGDHEITAVVELAGNQTGPNTYNVADLRQFDIVFDSNGDGNYTSADITNLDSYTDSLVVETGTLIAGGGTNNGPTLPDGTIDLIVDLQDQLDAMDCGGGPGSCDPFEQNFKDKDGNPITGPIILGLVDANNHGQYSSLSGEPPAGTPLTAIQHIDSVFANLTYNFMDNTASGLGGPFDFFFITKSDGSFNKKTIPEPATLLLLAAGLLGLGTSRRKNTL